ncbi:unnamed protein product, partial [Lampetra planeri]
NITLNIEGNINIMMLSICCRDPQTYMYMILLLSWEPVLISSYTIPTLFQQLRDPACTCSPATCSPAPSFQAFFPLIHAEFL